MRWTLGTAYESTGVAMVSKEEEELEALVVDGIVSALHGRRPELPALPLLTNPTGKILPE